MTQARNLPQWTGATLFNRALSDLSDSPPLSLSVISMVLDLLTPPPYHFILSHFIYFTLSQMTSCYVQGSPLHHSHSPSACLLISCLFLCLCLRCIAWYLPFSLCYVPEVSTGRHAYLTSQVSPLQGVLRCSTLQSCKTSPAKPLDFPKVNDTKGCPFTLSNCFILDVWCLLAFWRSLETTVLFFLCLCPTILDDILRYSLGYRRSYLL